MHFGATLRILRMDAGISLRTLAQAIGVSSAYLSRVENGHDAVPTPDRLVAIAKALDLPPHVVLELGHRVTPFVARYLEPVPSASRLFLEIARRDLRGPDLSRVMAFIDREFPARDSERSVPSPRLSSMLVPERVVRGFSCAHLDDVIDVAAARLAPENEGLSAPSLSDA